MIKANELRLNNWVNITGTPIQLTGEKFLYILAEDGLITRCDGVPLTPEILEKAGFVEGSVMNDGLIEYYLYEPAEFYGWYNKEEKVFEVDYNVNYHKPEVKVNTVHQLQNLYFALTGEELEINL